MKKPDTPAKPVKASAAKTPAKTPAKPAKTPAKTPAKPKAMPEAAPADPLAGRDRLVLAGKDGQNITLDASGPTPGIWIKGKGEAMMALYVSEQGHPTVGMYKNPGVANLDAGVTACDVAVALADEPILQVVADGKLMSISLVDLVDHITALNDEDDGLGDDVPARPTTPDGDREVEDAAKAPPTVQAGDEDENEGDETCSNK